MFIRAVQIKITSDNEPFGFECTFQPGLNIIKGKNSSGKSTLVNTIMYGLGMEELIGAKGTSTLTSAVRDEFEFQGTMRNIDKSAVLVEIQNKEGKVVTIRRPIRNKDKDHRLVEIFECALLTRPPAGPITPRTFYLHDKGAAIVEEGYLTYFSQFLGMKLPKVQLSTGDLALLYPQVIAAAIFIEQKHGWTDYIANVPFYKILSAPTRIVQYLLGLDNFSLEEKKAITEAKIAKIHSSWSYALYDLNSVIQPQGIALRGVNKILASEFDANVASISVRVDGEEMFVPDAIVAKTNEWNLIEARKKEGRKSASPDVIQLLDSETSKLERLRNRYEQISTESRLRSATLEEFQQLLLQAESDQKKNKTNQKLMDLGGPKRLALAESKCPTCGSDVESLSPPTEGIAPMDLSQNISYLDAQIRMLKRQIAGLEQMHEDAILALRRIENEINEQRAYVSDLRKAIVESDSTLEADIRKQLTLERSVRNYELADTRFLNFLEKAKQLAEELGQAERDRKNLPEDLYSETDKSKISLLEKNFRANASAFNYSSVSNISDVTINQSTLLPALGGIPLRDLPRKDIKSESSASDFVRLIWAYLIALYQTSAFRGLSGNHIGFLLFDEPGQHSMSEESQKAMVRLFSGTPALQSVVAASFDESQSVFNKVTDGSKFHLISLPEKFIGRLQHDGAM
ncbi:AAA family ATPase [Herbaspirillum seropedicae]|uniref:ATP-binding protein n=1 Tax=Herbaspirillum seropedicae TaxID=964 RepID=UPI003D98E003